MTLQRATVHSPSGHWPSHQAVGVLTLDFQERHRRRIRLRTDQGEEILCDLPKAIAMADGDGLQLEDGRWLRIRAAEEAIVEVGHRDARQFARLAWHLGNRHLPTEIGDQVLRIRPDHVIEAMLKGLGAHLAHVRAPFQPEGGAYGGHGHHHESDDRSHDHEH